MPYDALFETAVRGKYRYPYKGQITTEDLWDLPLQELDRVFKSLNAEVRQTKEESLLQVKDKQTETLERKIEIVKHIVSVRLAETAEAKNAADKATQKQRILGIIARKEDEALQGMTVEELKQMVENL